ncbi:hypothetical protein ACFWYW_50125 [Nonomuraea sp. NPDC059023]|uniref:hypothetical protein n=1 Tax=unclassified Nonomuraea TaxID=2593643 RepID=UPI00367A39FF
MRKEMRMYGKRALFASPLIAALLLGTVGTSQASIVQKSTGESQVTAASEAAPPVCRSFGKKQRKICSNGYAEGFEAGAKCGNPYYGRSNQEAYDIGFAAGFRAGQRTC